VPNRAYIFHYPYVTTPCFLINIGRSLEAGQLMETEKEGSYTWQGGVGPTNSLVAFSAICAHKLSYPTRTLSFLNYRPEKVRFVGKQEKTEERSQVIYCCSENSAYDPARGAEVIGGPARQPLAAIELEYDTDTGSIYAIGSRGGELYESFFEKFGFRLALDHKIENVRASVEEATIVYSHEMYSQHAVSC
jgi:Rieske Fe-S protein